MNQILLAERMQDVVQAAKEWAEARRDVLATGGQVAAAQYDRLARAEAALYALAK